MRRENSGQIRIIEAFLAVLIIFSSLTVSTNLNATRTAVKYDDLASVGLQALSKMDSDGSLGRYVDDGNWTALRDTLNLLLPVGVSFNLTVYDNQMRQVNNAIVSNGGFGSSDVASVEYVCVSRNPVFRSYIIRLLLAVVT